MNYVGFMNLKRDKLMMVGYNSSQVAFRNFQPELVVYNAGTDILDGDPLGLLKVRAYIMAFFYMSRMSLNWVTPWCR